MPADQKNAESRILASVGSGIRVANAPCSFGVMSGFEPDPRLTYLDVLDQIAVAGFTGTELGDWGFMPEEPRALNSALDQRGLAMVGAFTPVELSDPANLETSTATALRTARLLASCSSPDRCSGPFLILAADASLHPLRRRVAGSVRATHALSDAEVQAMAAATNHIARTVLDETGVPTVFHPHCATPVETILETSSFAMMTDPDLVGFCFDTGHVAYAGDKLEEWLTLFVERTRLVHFKDMNASVAHIARSNSFDYTAAVAYGLFCPLGKGAIDFAACLQLLRSAGYEGWIVVEDEIPPGRMPPLEAAKQDRAFLRTLGL
jgi:inosose dehydratase